MSTFSAAATGIFVTPIRGHDQSRGPCAVDFLSRIIHQSCSRRSACAGDRPVLGCEFRKLFDIENEGDPAIAEDRGRGNSRHRAVALLDALDDHLLMSA